MISIAMLAQHDPEYQAAALVTHVGAILAFIGLLGTGLAIIFSTPKLKPGQKPVSQSVVRVVGVLVVLLALGVAYMIW